MVELTELPINVQAVSDSVVSGDSGAVVLFLGTTREFTRGRQTESLDYEAYPEMALKQLQQLEAEARERWPIDQCTIIHRLGHLELAEASIAVAIATPHRVDAFEAAQWIMDEVKQVVPIWKKENWADGTTQWVHPGMDTPPQK
ncbi:MAG: molybdopterin converting factor [Blastopirellula sp.]|nr:MAG: molybdopterin converting factor [Blastopirellula sp.]